MDQPFTFSIILLAGGIGSRMGSATPKQFLPLKNKPIALYSFDILKKLTPNELVIVCDPSYQNYFHEESKTVLFAKPGKERQDSVYEGFKVLKKDVDIVLIHDSARPFIDKETILLLLDAAFKSGAATFGVPCSSTIKLADKDLNVTSTPKRDFLWEIQTPQALKTSILKEGFDKINSEALSATDDVSLAELLGLPVKIIRSSSKNFKITTKQDLAFAEFLLDNQGL